MIIKIIVCLEIFLLLMVSVRNYVVIMAKIGLNVWGWVNIFWKFFLFCLNF